MTTERIDARMHAPLKTRLTSHLISFYFSSASRSRPPPVSVRRRDEITHLL